MPSLILLLALLVPASAAPAQAAPIGAAPFTDPALAGVTAKVSQPAIELRDGAH